MSEQNVEELLVKHAEIAKRIAEVLRKANGKEAKSPAYHLLLGVLDSISEGKAVCNESLVISLTLECSRCEDVTIPPDASYVVGKCGFGVFEGRGMSRI